MDVEEVTAIYEFASGMMPSQGHWNKPKTAPQLVAHHLVLKDVPYEAACLAVWQIVVGDQVWPTPMLIRAGAHELCAPGWDIERLLFIRGDEIDMAMENVNAVAYVAASDKLGLMAKPRILESIGPDDRMKSVTVT